MGLLLDLQALVHEVVARMEAVDLVLQTLNVPARLHLFQLKD